MGLEGAVRLALRKELAAIADEAAREQRCQGARRGGARRRARRSTWRPIFEIDDVIDPAETRERISLTLRALPVPGPQPGRRRTLIDAW